MSGLSGLGGPAARLKRYAQIKNWRPEAARFLVEVLHRGAVARGDASAITGLGERTARDLPGEPLRDGVPGSPREKGPVSLRFQAETRDVLFARLSA